MKPLARLALAAALLLTLVGPAFAPPFEARPDIGPRPSIGEDRPDIPPGFDPSQPYLRVPPRILRERDAAEKLQSMIGQDNPNASDIKKAMLDFISAAIGDPVSRLSTYLLSTKGDSERVPLTPDTPNILVLRPSNPAYRPISDYLTTRLKARLETPIDRDSVQLLPFVFSSDGRNMLEREIPLRRRANGGSLDDVMAGNFDMLDNWMFSRLAGKTVVALGHVVIVDGRAAYEIRRADGGRRYIALDALDAAAGTVGFNFIPLGCETGDSAPLGTATKINDLDGLRAFKNVMQKSATSSFGALIADLTSSALKIQIDLTKLQSRIGINVDLMDQDERILRAYPINGSAGAASPSQPLFQMSAQASLAGSISGDISAAVLVRSYWFASMRPILQAWWFWIFEAMVGIGIIAALLELPFRHALTVSDRLAAAFILPLFGILCAVFIAMIFNEWLTTEPHGIIALAFGPIIAFSAFGGVQENFPDHRIAIMATKVVMLWCLTPLLVTLLIYGVESMRWLVVPSPLMASLGSAPAP